MAASSRHKSPETCPVCGEEVPRGSLACPECGADDQSGWREDADSVDVGDSDFDYDDFVEREFGSSPKPHGMNPVWWITAIVLLVAFVAFYVIARR